MDLQGIAAFFDDVGIDEAGDDAFAFEAFAEALREFRSAGGQDGFGMRSQREVMLAGVRRRSENRKWKIGPGEK